jgi:hypothetical protein
MHDLNTDGQRSVAGIADVDSFIHESFAAERDEPIGWETEP